MFLNKKELFIRKMEKVAEFIGGAAIIVALEAYFFFMFIHFG